MFKKKYKNIAILDFRDYSTEALKKIKSIKNVACLILPKDADKEWTNELSNINVENCASRIYLENGENIHMINGASLLDDDSVVDGEKYLANGAVIIATKEKKALVYINGAAVALKGANYSVEDLNGALIQAEPKGEYKVYPNHVKIDASMLENLPDDFTVIAGNSIEFENDVTVNRLKEKRISFIAGNSVLCRREIYGYVSANSQVGNTVKIKE
ncbi:MAG: hypothetical protein Q4D20_09710 [Clostridia bacterium]|nr:hypothetical protein [Clostridia bacterium]